jgi:predicted DCC family thiol-disulfide oxidoreductase YuxK
MTPGDNKDAEKMELVYDGQCPVCATYCEGLKRPDNLQLVDARQDSETLRDITKRGLDIDEGMVLKVDGKVFYGSEAMVEISRRLPRKGWTGFVNRLFFSSQAVGRVAYRVCKAGRSALLKVLGIGKINNLGRRDKHQS